MEFSKLKTMLRDGQATVEFTKKNGDKRVMKCTHNYDKITESFPEFEAPKNNIEKKEGLYKVWDLEKNAWRSFNEDQITNFTAVDSEHGINYER